MKALSFCLEVLGRLMLAIGATARFISCTETGAPRYGEESRCLSSCHHSRRPAHSRR